MRALITAWLLASWASLAAANPAMEGQWMLEVRPTGAPVVGVLEVERDGTEWRGFVEGGPAPVEVDGDNITIEIDSRDLRGFVFILRLEGTIDGDKMSGDYTVESDAEVPFTAGSWSAERYAPAPRATSPDPVDISGIWKPAPRCRLPQVFHGAHACSPGVARRLPDAL